MLRISVPSPSRAGRSHRLWAGASALALGASIAAPASAATFTASSESELRTAIANANASADGSSTITLTANIAITDPAAMPAASKPIVIDSAGFDVTGAGLNTFVVTLQGGGDFQFTRDNTFGGALNIGGSNLIVEGGGRLAAGALDSSGAASLIVRDAGSVFTTSRLNFLSDASASTIQVENGGVLRQAGSTSGSLGRTIGGTLTLNVTNPGSRLETDAPLSFSVGRVNATISDGGVMVVKNRLLLGSPTGTSQHLLTVKDSNSDLQVTGDLSLFRGRVEVLNGAHASAGSITLGGSASAQASDLLVSDIGSVVTVAGDVNLGSITGLTDNTTSTVTLMKGATLNLGAMRLGGLATRTGELVVGGKGAIEAAGHLNASSLTVTAGTGTLTFNHNSAGYDFDTAIGGGGEIRHAAGDTHLSGDSSAFGGATSITGGTLYVDNRLGSAASTLTVGAGGTLGGGGTVGGDVTVTGGRLAPGNSPGTLTIAGDLTLDAASVLDMEFGQSGVVGGPMNDLIKVAGNLTLDGTVNAAVTAGGTFDAGLYRIISYSGTLTNQTLAVGTMPSAGVTVQTAIPGQVNLVNTGGLPVNFWDGDGAGASGNGIVNGGAGTWTGANLNWTTGTGAVNTAYTPGDFSIFAGAPGVVTVGAVTSDGMQFAVDGYRLTGGTITIAGSVNVFRVGDGTADGKNYVAIIDSPIVGVGGGIQKTDLGTLILNGANTYSGVTNIQAGTLLFNGTMAGGGLALIVGANGTVGGTGTMRGGVVAGTLAPGGLTSPGALTVNGPLTFQASSKLRYRLGQADVVGGALNDLLVINGALTLNGTLDVTQSAGGAFGSGVYRLINYTGALTDNGLDIGSLPTGATGVVQTSIANQVNLLVTAAPAGPGPGGGTTTPPPPKVFDFWDGGGVAADGTITGGDGVWRAGAANWTTADGSASGDYDDDVFAIFAGTGGTVTVDGSAGAIAVGGLQFAADGYQVVGDPVTLTDPGTVIRVGDGTTAGAAFVARIGSALIGAGGLDKTDAGTLVLTGENTYAGGTRVSGGTLQIGDGGKGGSIQGDVQVEGLLAFNRADDVVFGGVISGAGVLAQIGAGATTLTADSGAFAGLTEVRGGTLTVDGALGGAVAVFGGARLTGVGKVGALLNQPGGVVAPGHGDIGVLTVAGDYAGAGGVLELDARLGAAPAADRLVVQGATSGATLVKLNRLAGGQGALSPDGLVLVQVDGASGGTFALAEGDYRLGGETVLVNGAYGYALRKDADGDWRLRSGEGASAPLYQPGVPVYEAYGQALQLLNGVGALRERIGGRRWSDDGVWGRIEGGHAKLEPERSTGDARLKADRWKLQFGVDRTLREDLAGGRLTGAVTAHYGEVSADVASPNGAGEVRAKGYGVGASLTWSNAAGDYLDGYAQASWFDSDLKSRLLGVRADGAGGDGYALSLEAGKAIAAGERLRFTPQAQLTYSRVGFDGFTDPFGAVVSSDKSDSLVARAGLAMDFELGERGGLYAVANVSHEFGDGVRVDVSGVRLEARRERTWGGLAAGGTYGWNDGRYTIYGQASAETSLSAFGDSYEVTGTAGFRMRF